MAPLLLQEESRRDQDDVNVGDTGEGQEQISTSVTDYQNKILQEAAELDLDNVEIHPLSLEELRGRQGEIGPVDVAAAVLSNKHMQDQLRAQLHDHLNNMKVSTGFNMPIYRIKLFRWISITVCSD